MCEFMHVNSNETSSSTNGRPLTTLGRNASSQFEHEVLLERSIGILHEQRVKDAYIHASKHADIHLSIHPLINLYIHVHMHIYTERYELIITPTSQECGLDTGYSS